MGEITNQANRINDLFSTTYDVDEEDKSNSEELMTHPDFHKFWEILRDGDAVDLYDLWRIAPFNSGNGWDEKRWSDEDNKYGTDLFDLHFGRLAACDDAIQKLIGATDAIHQGAKTARSELKAVWEGTDADAAQEKLQKLETAAQKASYEAWPELMQNFRSMRDETKRIIREFVEWGSQSGECTQFVGAYKSIEDNLARMIATSASNYSSREEIFEAFDLFSDDEDIQNSLNNLDRLANDFNGMLIQGRERVRNTNHAVSQALTLFAEQVGESGRSVYGSSMNPFADLAPPKESGPTEEGGEHEAGGEAGSGVDTGGGDTGGGGGPTGGGGGPTGGGGGGGAPTGGGGGTAPAETGVETPQQPEKGTNPVTGQPLEVDPATGQPYPIDPTTGEPIKDAGDDQDTTTTTHGENEITITEPSKTGEMQVGVDDGKGGAKNYNLDFDPENNPKDGKDDSVGAGAAGGYGPQGAGKDGVAGGKGGGPEDEVHTPGEDGKIRIKDGDLEIVAEQPLGPDGATVVTVDDGKGEPTTQILGDKENVDEYKRMLAQDETRLTGYREELEGREHVSKQEWDELKKEEQSFRERGGQIDVGDDKLAEKVDEGKHSAEERSTPKSVFDEAKGDDKSAGIGKSAFDEDSKGGGAGVGGGSSGMSGSSGGGAGGSGAVGGGIGGSAQQLDPGARSGVGAPAGGGGAGVGTAPGGAEPAAAASGASSARGGAGAGMMAPPMMGGGAGGGGGDEQRSTNAAYQVHGGLFEPEVAEGPFGVARISGSLDDEEG